MSLSVLSDEQAQIVRIVSWMEWESMIQLCCYKGKCGNKPYLPEAMLRLYLPQNLYSLSDEATVAEAIDSHAFSDFCGVDSSNQLPDGDTLGRFRNLLIRKWAARGVVCASSRAASGKRTAAETGNDCGFDDHRRSILHKNSEHQRDPDAHQVKKGNAWHFDYKAHIGADRDSGLVRTRKITATNVHDGTMVPELLTGQEEIVHGDSGYLGAEKRESAIARHKQDTKIKYRINRRPSQLRKLSFSGQYAARKAEHRKSSVRVKVEHVFGIAKGIFRYRKPRYRGPRKQTAKLNILFTLANLILADRGPAWQSDWVASAFGNQEYLTLFC